MVNILFLVLITFQLTDIFYYEKYEDKNGDIFYFTSPINYSDNWKYKEVVSTKDGKKEGKSTIFRKDEYTETRLLEGFYKNDVKDSLWTAYCTDGKNKGITFYYKNGKINGLCILYYISGYIKEICFAKDGLIDSVWTTYYDNSVIEYSKASLGKIKSKGWFKSGKSHGQLEKYYEDGKIKSVCTYVNGILNGICKNYYNNGNIESESEYKNGDLEDKYSEYFDSGKIRIAGSYKSNIKDNKWIYYYENGNIKMEGNYLDNEMDGQWVFYKSDQSKTKTVSFTSGVADTPVPNWDQPEYQWGKNVIQEIVLGSKATKEGEIYQEKDRFKLEEIPMVKLSYTTLYGNSYFSCFLYKYNENKNRYEFTFFYGVLTEDGDDYIYFDLKSPEIGKIGKWKISLYDNYNKIKEFYYVVEE
ncbi:MAG: toxin-antitoxin system YwqK family antitoxin [Candidatus Coatesbacteria bacterium]|nr:toxin-antitoxin system YwqK family antitoxin [Candidatus Coatesbacteria bacterium]